MKFPNKMLVFSRNLWVTVNLLAVSGKREFRQRFSQFSDAQCPVRSKIAKPAGVSIANP
jgi:hypothetical protein